MRRRLGFLLALGALVFTAVPVAAEYSNGDTTTRFVTVESGKVYEFSELAAPTDLTLKGRGRIVDDLTGRVIALRGVENTPEGSSLVLPQLPVGTFTVETGSGRAVLRIIPEAGTPIELDQPDGRVVPLLLSTAVLLLVLALVLRIRGRTRLLALTLLPLAGAPLLYDDQEPQAVSSWESCAAYLTPEPRETELLRRNCKVRFLLGMLGEDGTGAAAVETYMRQATDPVCHEVAYLVGFYFSRTNTDPLVAARALLPGCDDGMAHGVLEALSLFNDDEKFLQITAELCDRFPGGVMRRTCSHGLGHAMLWRTNGDLGKAHDLCMRTADLREGGQTEAFARKVLPVTDDVFSHRDECLSASIMEWADRWEFERRVGRPGSLLPELEEPMDVCLREGHTEIFYIGCYLGTNYRTRDAGEAARRCNESTAYPVSCFATIGDNLVLFTEANLGVELTESRALGHAGTCSLAEDPRAGDACAAALSHRYLLNTRDGTKGESLCAKLESGLRDGCGDGLRIAADTLRGRGLEIALTGTITGDGS